MTHRWRVFGRGQKLPGLLLLAAGAVVAIAAPIIYLSTRSEPAPRPVNEGIAVALAQQEQPDSPPSASTTTVDATPAEATATSVSAPVVAASEAAPAPADGGGDGDGDGDGTTTPRSAPRDDPATDRSSESAAAPVSSSTPAARPAEEDPDLAATTPATQAAAPVRLEIPAVGMDAPIDAVGVEDNGEMEVPELVERIGWYRYGPAPGADSGSVVMSGHVDSAEQGPGAFAGLSQVSAGDLVTVTDDAGQTVQYEVVGKEIFDKTSVPLNDLFSRSGAARLTLITCGGGFDAQARSYLENIVVTAVPVT